MPRSTGLWQKIITYQSTTIPRDSRFFARATSQEKRSAGTRQFRPLVGAEVLKNQIPSFFVVRYVRTGATIPAADPIEISSRRTWFLISLFNARRAGGFSLPIASRSRGKLIVTDERAAGRAQRHGTVRRLADSSHVCGKAPRNGFSLFLTREPRNEPEYFINARDIIEIRSNRAEHPSRGWNGDAEKPCSREQCAFSATRIFLLRLARVFSPPGPWEVVRADLQYRFLFSLA